MANGALPFSLATSKFYPKYSMLTAIAVTGASDTHTPNLSIAPSSTITNVNNEVVAKLYNATNDFYVTASHGSIVFQIVPVAGNIDIQIATSIDSVNWDVPSGWTNKTNVTTSSTLRLTGLAIDEYLRLTIVCNSGDYYVNVLTGGGELWVQHTL